MMHNESGFKTGDLVIGSPDPSRSIFSATGARLSDSGVSIYGDPKLLQEHQKEMTRSLLRNGGKPLEPVATGKKGKKTKTKSTTPDNQYAAMLESMLYASEDQKSSDTIQTQTPITAAEETSVHFENSFGKMRAKVEQLIEHPMAYMLVFRNEDSMVFEPKTGESLTFYSDKKQSTQVYYPGVTFDSPDSDKKFMILFKLPEENQE